MPVTEIRKKILQERDMKIGVTGYTDLNLILYLKKVENQNEFRIGIFDINWVLVGEDLRPQIELIIRDLIGIKYEEV